MTSKRTLWVVLVALSLAIAAPAAAADSLRRGAELTIRGSNGYRIYAEREDGYLLLIAAKGELRHEGTLKSAGGAAYITEVATPTPNGIEARLGKLGTISVRFKPRGPAHRLRDAPPGCYQAIRPGVFLGQIEFDGEHEFTAVDASRAFGNLTLERGSCSSDRPASGPAAEALARITRPAEKPTEVGLRAEHSDRRYGVQFTATAGPGSDLAPEHATKAERRYFEAITFSKYRRITIIRAATVASDDPASFAFNDPLTALMATPPLPFAGTASLQRTDNTEPGPWIGSLTVELPGAPATPLAGPGFEAKVNYRGFESF